MNKKLLSYLITATGSAMLGLSVAYQNGLLSMIAGAVLFMNGVSVGHRQAEVTN